MGLGGDQAGRFKNLILEMRSFTAPDPTILDTNSYPISTPAVSISATVFFASNLAQSETLVLKGVGKANVQLSRGSPGFTAVVASGGASVIGSTALNLQVQCTTNVAWRVQFQLATSIPAAVTFAFLSGGAGTFDGSLSGLTLCRLTDEAVLAAATTPEEQWADDYINVFKTLNPKVSRPMGFTNPNGGNVSQSRYIQNWRTSVNGFSERYEPRAIAADIGGGAMCTTGTNTYLCGLQPDATGGYVDGEMIHVKIINASTLAPLTINSGSRGAAPLLFGLGSSAGLALTSGSIPANTLATLTYDSALGGFLYQAGGQTVTMAYELLVAFSNRVGVDYWLNFPSYFDNASVSAVTAIVRAGLSSSLNAYFEYGNEIWNFGFPATFYANSKGTALGFPSDNARRFYGWYALRSMQIFGLVEAAWSPRSASQMKRVLAFQAFGATSSTSTYRLQGSDLASVANGGQGNATYVSYTGDANYRTVGSRPIDKCEVLSYATYFSGAQLTNFDGNYLLLQSTKTINGATLASPVVLQTSTTHGYTSGQRAQLAAFTGGWTSLNAQSQTVTVIDSTHFSVPIDTTGLAAYSANGGTSARYRNEMAGLVAAADNYALGTPTSIAAAFTWVDGDIRNGNNYGVTGVSPGDQTMTQLYSAANGTGIYPQWDVVATTFGKTIELYEGGYEGWYPSTASCTALGISTTYGGSTGKIAVMLDGFKKSDYFRRIVYDQQTQFMASPKSTTWAWLLLPGTNQWATHIGTDVFSTTYKSWDQQVLYNAGKSRLVASG